MTRLLEEAIGELRKLPAPAQDSLAALILAEIADDRAWDESFARSQDQLSRLAAEAREDVAKGRVRDLSRRTP